MYASSGTVVISGGSGGYGNPLPIMTLPVPERFHLTYPPYVLFRDPFNHNSHVTDEWTVNGSFSIVDTVGYWWPGFGITCLEGNGDLQAGQTTTYVDAFIATVRVNFDEGDQYYITVGGHKVTFDYSMGVVTVDMEGADCYYWTSQWGELGNKYPGNWANITAGWNNIDVYCQTDDSDPNQLQIGCVVGDYHEISGVSRGTAFQFDTTISRGDDSIAIGGSGTGQFSTFGLYVPMADLFEEVQFFWIDLDGTYWWDWGS